MVGISKTGLDNVDEKLAYIEMEYKNAKANYKSAKEKLKWIFEVKNCDHDVVCTGCSQLITYECKKCKYVWYD